MEESKVEMKEENILNLNGPDDEVELEVDWEYEYEKGKNNVAMLSKIPMEERLKIIRKKNKRVKSMKSATDEEAVNKYCVSEEERTKFLKILETIRENQTETIEATTKEENPNNVEFANVLIKAIEANDCPCVMALTRGCFPSFLYRIKRDRYTLFGYSCKEFSDECALFFFGERFEGSESFLSEALIAKNEGIAMFLIEEGENINEYCFYGYYSIIHIALLTQCLEVFKLLIDKGVSIELKTKEGNTPLHLAADIDNAEAAKFLIKRGAHIEAKNDRRKTPLHNAAYENSFEVAKLLLKRGADIGTKDNRGETPLHLAAEKNSFGIAQLLIERGAEINAKSPIKRTPLHKTAYGNSFEVAQLLIERGADIEAKDYLGETPLHLAAEKNSFGIAQLLIEGGADINVKNETGETPLHKAVGNSLGIAKLLLERGAEVNVKDKYGETPIYKVEYYKRLEITQLLIDKGADIEVKDANFYFDKDDHFIKKRKNSSSPNEYRSSRPPSTSRFSSRFSMFSIPHPPPTSV